MFITVEGVDGSGKTMLAKWLEHHYTSKGLDVILTREPGGTEVGCQLRKLLLSSQSHIPSQAELLLFQADRALHIDTVIWPAIVRGDVVICDRYLDSTIAYQGYGRQRWDIETLLNLHTIASGGTPLFPDLTFVLDLPVELSIQRARSRNAQDGKTVEEGKFEDLDLDFHRRVREGYLRQSQTDGRYKVIDASGPTWTVIQQAMDTLTERNLS